jgi:hypothetical protein
MLRNAEVHGTRVGEGANVQTLHVGVAGVEQLHAGVDQAHGCDLLET